MKKLIILTLTLIAVCFFSNETIAQKTAKKADPTVQANKYVNAGNNTAVKIHQPIKQEVKDALLARRAEVVASTTLTPAEKQTIIDQIDARLAALEN